MTPELAALYILYAGAALLAVVAAGALLVVVGGFLLGALEAMTERAEQAGRRPPPPPSRQAVPRESPDKPAEPWVPPSKRENNPEHYTLGADRDGEDPYQF